MKEQHPVLPDFEADQFDKDSAALLRLSARGIITDSQKRDGFKRLTKHIETEIRKALKGRAAGG